MSRYQGPGLTKEDKLKIILAIKKGLIDPKDITGSEQLDLTGVPESGVSDQEIECHDGGRGFMYNEYKDKAGKVFKLQNLPPLVPILFIFFAWSTEINDISVVNEICFLEHGKVQVIRHLLQTLNLEL